MSGKSEFAEEEYAYPDDLSRLLEKSGAHILVAAPVDPDRAEELPLDLATADELAFDWLGLLEWISANIN